MFGLQAANMVLKSLNESSVHFTFSIFIAFPFQNMHQLRNGKRKHHSHSKFIANALDAESLDWIFFFWSLIQFGVMKFYLHTLRFYFPRTIKCSNQKKIKPRTFRKKCGGVICRYSCIFVVLYCASGKCRIGVTVRLMRRHIYNQLIIIEEPSQSSLNSHPTTPTKTANIFFGQL